MTQLHGFTVKIFGKVRNEITFCYINKSKSNLLHIGFYFHETDNKCSVLFTISFIRFVLLYGALLLWAIDSQQCPIGGFSPCNILLPSQAYFLTSMILDAKHEKNGWEQPRFFSHLHRKVSAYSSLKLSNTSRNKFGFS